MYENNSDGVVPALRCLCARGCRTPSITRIRAQVIVETFTVVYVRSVNFVKDLFFFTIVHDS